MPAFNLAFLLIAVATLEGCAREASSTTGLGASKGEFRDCTRDGTHNDVQSLGRVIVIKRDADGTRLDLAFDDGQDQGLDPVNGTSRRLFASRLFAWRAAGNQGVLTDVENIATYACHDITYAQAPDLPRRETRVH